MFPSIPILALLLAPLLVSAKVTTSDGKNAIVPGRYIIELETQNLQKRASKDQPFNVEGVSPPPFPSLPLSVVRVADFQYFRRSIAPLFRSHSPRQTRYDDDRFSHWIFLRLDYYRHSSQIHFSSFIQIICLPWCCRRCR